MKNGNFTQLFFKQFTELRFTRMQNEKNEQNAVNEVFINFLLAAYIVENLNNRKEIINCYSRDRARNYNIEFKWMPIVIIIYLSWTKGHKQLCTLKF